MFPSQKCEGQECISIASAAGVDLCKSQPWSASPPATMLECDAIAAKHLQVTFNSTAQPEYSVVCTGVPMDFMHAKGHRASNISILRLPLLPCSTGVTSVSAAFCVQWDIGGVPRPLSLPDKEISVSDIEEADILREFHLCMMQLGKGEMPENEQEEQREDMPQNVDGDHADQQLLSATPRQMEHKDRFVSREIRNPSIYRFRIILMAALTPLMGAVQPPEAVPTFPEPTQAQSLCTDPGSEESSSAGVIDQ